MYNPNINQSNAFASDKRKISRKQKINLIRRSLSFSSVVNCFGMPCILVGSPAFTIRTFCKRKKRFQQGH